MRIARKNCDTMADNDVLFNNNRNLIARANDWVPVVAVILVETIAVSSVKKTINTTSNYTTSNITRLKKASTKVNLNTLSFSVEEGVAVAKKVDNQMLLETMNKRIDDLNANFDARIGGLDGKLSGLTNKIDQINDNVIKLQTTSNLQQDHKKTRWEKFKTYSGWVVALVIAAIGWYFAKR